MKRRGLAIVAHCSKPALSHVAAIPACFLLSASIFLANPQALIAGPSQAEYFCCLQPRGPEPRNLDCQRLELTPSRCAQIIDEFDAARVRSVNDADSASRETTNSRAATQAEYLCCTQPNNPRNKNLNCASRGLTVQRCKQVIAETDAGRAQPNQALEPTPSSRPD